MVAMTITKALQVFQPFLHPLICHDIILLLKKL